MKVQSNIDRTLVNKAVSALVEYHSDRATKIEKGKPKQDLLGNEWPVHVQFGLDVAPVERSRKPVRLLIPNPLYLLPKGNDQGVEEPDVCLIVKEESKAWVKEIVQQFEDRMGCVKKVLGLDSLRKQHPRFQQRRDLLQKYDVFMADDRILPMLTSALGKDFIKSKKLPIPIRLTRKEALPFAIQRNLSATYMTVSPGTSISIRAGNTGMVPKMLVENVIAIAEKAAEKMPRKWGNIRSITVKTPVSTSLPFYHKAPRELLEITKMLGLTPAFKDRADPEAKGNNSQGDYPKRERELAAKSPLVQAFKKQKKSIIEAERNKPEQEQPSVVKTKKAKTGHLPSGKRNVGDFDAKSDEKKYQKEATTIAAAGKRDSGIMKAEREEKLVFSPSRRFKGSKRGYVFKMGEKGCGYYLDELPVINKRVLEALLRSSNQRERPARRSKSPGKRKERS